MAENFRRRFKREEFVKEMIDHLSSMPIEKENHDLIRKNAEHKAKKYEETIRLLDQVSKTLSDIAEESGDPDLKKKAEAGIKQIDEAVNTYGETSLTFNSVWFNYKD